MKCHQCGKMMNVAKQMEFNSYKIDGWKCPCGEIYYNPEQAQRILILNKLKRHAPKVKLGKIRSNLIIRVPTDLEYALNLEKGEDVRLEIEDGGFKVVPA